MNKKMLSVSEKRELWNFCESVRSKVMLAYECRNIISGNDDDSIIIRLKRGTESYNEAIVKNEDELEIINHIAHLFIAGEDYRDASCNDGERIKRYRKAYVYTDANDATYLEFYHKGQFNNPPKTSELYMTALQVLEQREEVFEDWL